jgi:intracellular sulfur oxidation DsrE/DsrF family protein
MSKFRHIARAATMAGIAVLVATSLSAAQEVWQSPPPVPKHSAAPQKRSAHGTMPAKPSATAQMPNQSALARMASSTADQEHRLILQVNTNDPAAMNLALNNAMNVTQHYKELGEKVEIEVITFGPGLHMLRDDTSPVKARIETMALSTPEISFKACGNTQENMHKAENKDIPIVPQAQVVKSGVVRILELEEQGWTYVKP